MNNYKLSRYNILFDYKDQYYMYNTMSNALVEIEAKLYDPLYNSYLPEGILNKYKNDLIKGNFIVPNSLDELWKFNYLFKRKQFSNYLGLTIAPTLNCNCKCPYCFQPSINEKMNEKTYERIFEYILKNFTKNNIRNASIAWYGGEPLLVKEDIIKFHQKLSLFIRNNLIDCKIITNGVLLDREFIITLRKFTKISGIQITFDGAQEIHDKRRILKNGNGTYNTIIGNLKSVIDLIPVTIRVNIDKKSGDSIDNLLKHFVSIGLNKRKNLFLYFGHLRKYTTNIKEDSSNFYSGDEFEYIEMNLTHELREYNFTHSDVLYPRPYPFCSLPHYNSFVVAPNGDLYKCWNMIGNDDLIVGNIETIESEKRPAYFKFLNFNPLNYDKCRNCKLLPICSGGCPYVRMGLSAIDEDKQSCDNSENLLIAKLKDKIDYENEKQKGE